MNQRKLWYVKTAGQDPGTGLQWKLLQDIENDAAVTAASSITSYAFAFHARLEALQHCSNLRILVVPAPVKEPSTSGLNLLATFEKLEVLELNSADISEVELRSWNFPKLRKLVLNNMVLSTGLLKWIRGLTTLQCLKFCDCTYGESLQLLSKLKNLNKLVVTGDFSFLAHDIDFVKSLDELSSLTLEIETPGTSCLYALFYCKAAIHLKLRGTFNPSQMLALCNISNLHSLLISATFGFSIPPAFKDLHNLHTFSIIDKKNHFDSIEGLDNIPEHVSRVALDLKCPVLENLYKVLSMVAGHVTKLSLKLNCIPGTLGLRAFDNLQSLELISKETCHETIFEEVRALSQLKHLSIGGFFNCEAQLTELLPELNVTSLSVGNAVLTSNGLRHISEQQNLRALSLECCCLPSFNLDFFPSFLFLKELNLVRCPDLHDYLPGVLRIPQLQSIHFVNLLINRIVPEGSCNGHCSQKNAVPLQLRVKHDRT